MFDADMTEVDWLSGADPRGLVGYVRRVQNKRKQRLLACGLCRGVWHLIGVLPEARACVEFAEVYADGAGAKKRLRKLCEANRRRYGRDKDVAVAGAAHAAQGTCLPDAAEAVGWVWHGLGYTSRVDHAAPSGVKLLHCVFGNPFRPVDLAPAWLTSDVVGVARAIYGDRAFHDLPVLADALQDAGCDDAAVLEHCRGPGPHVRGCWVTDMLKGRA